MASPYFAKLRFAVWISFDNTPHAHAWTHPKTCLVYLHKENAITVTARFVWQGDIKSAGRGCWFIKMPLCLGSIVQGSHSFLGMRTSFPSQSNWLNARSATLRHINVRSKCPFGASQSPRARHLSSKSWQSSLLKLQQARKSLRPQQFRKFFCVSRS